MAGCLMVILTVLFRVGNDLLDRKKKNKVV